MPLPNTNGLPQGLVGTGDGHLNDPTNPYYGFNNPNSPNYGNVPPGYGGNTPSTPPSGTPGMGNNMIQQLLDAINNPQQQQNQAAPTGQAGLNPFFNTPMYQVMFGENNNQVDPTQRFQADPGFAFNQEQTAKQMQQYGAAKGLLESGPFQVEMQKQLQGNQNQQYQTWLGQQQNLYGSYQNQLQSLMGFGAGQTGGAQAAQNGQQLASLLGNYNYGTGQAIGAGQLGVGDNISSILANQGVYNANAYLNTGGALANQYGNMLGMQMQQNNANQQAGNTQMNLGGGVTGGAQVPQGTGSWSQRQF